MKIVIRPKRPRRQGRPKTTSRLKQCNKSNNLMRRFYSGRKPIPQSTPLAKIPYGFETLD